MRNRDFTREELILALDVYCSASSKSFNARTPEVIELSEFFRRVALKTGEEISDNFRSPNGIAMILLNFLEIQHPGKGLAHGSKAHRKLWEEFSSIEKRRELSIIAKEIRLQMSSEDQIIPHFFDGDVKEITVPEGREIVRTHIMRELNPALVRSKKDAVLEKIGYLACEACDFNFNKTYGDRGSDFIECHHTKPLHTLESESNTNLDDFALLCANCHRMIHVRNPWLMIDELREVLKRASSMD